MSITFRFFLVIINLLQKTINMHNFYAKYSKILDICKRFLNNIVYEQIRRDSKTGNKPNITTN